MQKFNIGDKVEMVNKSVTGWGSLSEIASYYNDFPYGYVTKYRGNTVVVDNNPFTRSGNFFNESDLKPCSSAKEDMTYILKYTDDDSDECSEEFDSKEEALEWIEEHDEDIDFDETVEVLEVSRTFEVEKANKYKLVEE